MTTPNLSEAGHRVVDQVARSADEAVLASQRAAIDALDSLAAAVQHARREVGPMLEQAGDNAGELANQGVDALRLAARRLRLQARQAQRSTVASIQDEPVKAVLVAAAAGAALVALVALLARSRERG